MSLLPNLNMRAQKDGVNSVYTCAVTVWILRNIQKEYKQIPI